MCGLSGFVGRSTNPKLSFDLANALFLKTETRGEHASGFWACEEGDGKVFFDKEGVKSSIYINRPDWCEKFAAAKSDLLLTHCRLSSLGVGSERTNRNNHPHVSEDRTVALVHNGKIPEFNSLRSRYETSSDCDSEILLRMFESATIHKNKSEMVAKEFPNISPDIGYRLLGLKEIFSRVNYGAMAVAIGERGNDGSRYLWLFRDDERPLHVVDMRKELGQIFFCSTAEIWQQATASTPSLQSIITDKQVIIQFPALQIWLLGINPNETDPVKAWTIRKFKISKSKYYGDWKKEDELEEQKRFKRPANKPKVSVVGRLDQSEDVVENQEPAEMLSHGIPASKANGTNKVTRTTDTEMCHKVGCQCFRTHSDPSGRNPVPPSLTPQLPALGVEKKKTTNNPRQHDGHDQGVVAEELCFAEPIPLAATVTNEELMDMATYEREMSRLSDTVKSIDKFVKEFVYGEVEIPARKFDILIESIRDAASELSGMLILLNDKS